MDVFHTDAICVCAVLENKLFQVQKGTLVLCVLPDLRSKITSAQSCVGNLVSLIKSSWEWIALVVLVMPAVSLILGC